MRRPILAGLAAALALAGCGETDGWPTGSAPPPTAAASVAAGTASPVARPPAVTAPPATASATASPQPSVAPTNVYAGTRAGQLRDELAAIEPRVYVPHELSGTVLVIDPTTLEVIDGFATGSLAHHVTPSWDMTRLYVNNMASDTLTEIDAATGQVIGSISVPRPYNLYFTPDGASAIVVAEPYNQLVFYERATWAHIGTVALPYSGIDHLDFSADGSYLIVGAEFAGWIVKVDVVALEAVAELEVGGLPIDVKVSPDGSLFYVANQGRHGVSVIDPVSMTEVGFIATGRGAHGLAVSRDGASLYVSNRDEGTISVIDFATRGVVATWQVGGSPDMLNVSADGTQLWASNRYGNTVSVIDTSNGSLLARITVDQAPHGLTFFPQPGSVSIGHNGVYR